jgi:hypothetical protein
MIIKIVHIIVKMIIIINIINLLFNYYIKKTKTLFKKK